MKRILALLLCFCLCVSLIPAAYAEDTDEIIILDEAYLDGDDELIDIVDPEAVPRTYDRQNSDVIASGDCGLTEDDDLSWTVYSDGELVIAGWGDMTDYHWFESAPWKEYDDSATGFRITSVSIEEGVRRIGYNAFSEMDAVETVSIAASVEEIGYAAFGGCTALKAFTVAAGSETFCALNGVLFSKDRETLVCFPGGKLSPAVLSYDVPDGTVNISPGAFLKTPYLSTLNLPSSLRTIGASALEGCTELRRLYLPEGMTELPRSMCKDCNMLWDLYLPSSLTTIAYGAFENCEGLYRVFLPFGLQTIDVCAFKGSGLNYIEIPSGVSELSTQAFMECPWLETVVVGSGVTEIGDWVFDGCESLQRVIFTGSAPELTKYKQGSPETGSFLNASFTALYPAEDSSWSASVRSANYGGNVSWEPYTDGLYIKIQPVSNLVYVGWTAEFNVVIGCAAETVYRWQYKTPDALSGPWQSVPASWSDDASLHVPGTMELNGAMFRCQLSSGSTTIWTDEVELTVKTSEEPYIITQPQSAAVNVGETATFEVEAGGKELTYEWQYSVNGKNDDWKKSTGSGANTPSFPVLVKSYRNGYQYRCRIYNAAGTVYTEPATLTALGRVVITGQPKSVSAKENTTAKFTVTASGLAPLTYQWQVSSSGKGDDWVDSTLAGAKTATLSVNASTYRSGYQYRCRVGNVGGSVYSTPATLTVLSMPVITTQPKDVSTHDGDTVSFSVKAKGSGLSYQWQYRTSATAAWTDSSGAAAKKTDYQLSAFSYRNGYQYRCAVTNEVGTVFSDPATLHVSKLVKPTITTQPKSVSVKAGSTATFSVTASGSDLSYQWQYRTSSADTWKNSANTGAKTATFPVKAESYRNGYQYRCVITNKAGSASSSAATLTVLTVPTIKTQPKSVNATAGSTAKFTVTASGGGLSYQWQYRTSSADTWKNSTITGAKTATLSVTAESYRSGYQYRCKVTNAAGTATSDAATLTVLAKPTITTQPKSVSAIAGSTVKFSVAASGGGLSYQWQYRTSSTGEWKNSVNTGAKTATFPVKAESYRNGYQYRCVITNALGTVYSNVATLTITSSNLVPREFDF